MSELIDIFPPESAEGPVGYFRRLAARNGYASWKALVRASGVNPTLNSLWKNHKHFELLGLEAQWLSDTLPSTLDGTGLYDTFFLRTVSDPICAHCITSGYIRHAWSHCFVTACPEHQCLLIDTCPHCQSKLLSSRPGIAQCECGYDLSYSKTSPASAVQCWMSARLAGDMAPFQGIEELGEPKDYLSLAKLLFQLTVRYDPATRTRPGKVVRPKNVSEAVAFLEPIVALFEDFRPRFSAHIAARFSAGAPDKCSLSGRLGVWYTSLHRLCRKPVAFPVVWEIFSDAVFDNFDGLLRGESGLTPSAGKQRKQLALPEAARLIGISSPVLQKAVEQELVKASVNRQGINYRISMVARDEAERVRLLRDGWLSESRAAKALGVAESVLQNLVKSGILDSDKNWRHVFYKAGPIAADMLQPLIDRVLGFSRDGQTDDTFRFNDLTARRTVDVKALTSLYQAIFCGEVRAIGRDGQHGLGGFMFAREDVKRYVGSAALGGALTLTQLEAVTGWKYESLSRWTTLGLLESENTVLQGRAARIVTVAALARFRREWILVSEIASAAGSKGSAVTRHLEAHGVPICGQTDPADGPRRGGLIRFSDLVSLAGLAARP